MWVYPLIDKVYKFRQRRTGESLLVGLPANPQRVIGAGRRGVGSKFKYQTSFDVGQDKPALWLKADRREMENSPSPTLSH